MSVKLISSDGEVFVVEEKVAKMSVMLKNMLENIGRMCDDEEAIPIPKVESSILRLVIQWATHHKDDPLPLPGEEESGRSAFISLWDAQFLKVDQATLFQIILAANFLDIKGLLEVSCQAVANMIRGKSPEEIRKTFNIKNDFTEQEEQQVRLENSWCEAE